MRFVTNKEIRNLEQKAMREYDPVNGQMVAPARVVAAVIERYYIQQEELERIHERTGGILR